MTSKHKKLKKRNRKFLGYQIISKDGNIDIPGNFYSFEIIRTKRVLDEFFRKDKSGQWIVVPVYSGEIEEPTFV
jgi:hypothetical protein